MSEKLLIKDVMSRPVTISKSAPITEALDKLLDECIDPLIVTNGSSVVGTVSRKSIAEIMGSRRMGSKRNVSISPTQIHVANVVVENSTAAYPDQEIDVLIPLIQHYKMVAVLDDEHRLIGQVNAGDVLKVVRPGCSIDEVMEDAPTILADERVVHLRRRMLDEDIPAFIVMDENLVAGIVTGTDVAKAMRSFREVVDDRYQDNRIRNLLVRDIMTSPVLSVESGGSVEDVVDLMLRKDISSVPITADGRVSGMVTRASLISAL